ncbi:MAG TPA: hypothetical protein VIM03_00585 [Thermoleophilaceae bacterium]
MARRSLKPQLNQIRTWARQGRTDAWIAHRLDVSVSDIRGFKREHGLTEADGESDAPATGASGDEELDLRAEDDALVAAALEEEAEETVDSEQGTESEDQDASESEAGDEQPKPRRRGRRGGRGRGRGGRGGRPRALEGTFDHGDEGYGLWLDPAVQDDPVYAEHWAGHRPVTITVEAERIVIRRAGEESDSDGDADENDGD